MLDCKDLGDRMAQQGHEEIQGHLVMLDRSVTPDQGVNQVPMDPLVSPVKQALLVAPGLLVPLGPQVTPGLRDLLVRLGHSDRRAKSETLVHLEMPEVLD